MSIESIKLGKYQNNWLQEVKGRGRRWGRAELFILCIGLTNLFKWGMNTSDKTQQGKGSVCMLGLL